MHRVGQSLLVVEGDDGRAFGAVVAIRWPKGGNEARDVLCRSFLVTIDGEEATRFSAVMPPVDLAPDLKKKGYSVDANSSCTGGRFPALSGKWAKWEIREI
jgi:hypothetical protein